jgi:polysaccharide biosynthesis/export protein
MQTKLSPGSPACALSAAKRDIAIELGTRSTSGPKGHSLWRLAILATAIGLPGCGTVDMSHMQRAPLEPVSYFVPSKLPPYRIQVGDVLAVRLLLNPELDEEVTVRPDGYISTTVAPNVAAYGLTVPQLDAELRRDYARQLTNPMVNVVVRSFAPTRIYVGGEVSVPGEYIDVGPTLTLSQAISRAGGVKISGDRTSVFIIRRGPGDVPEFLKTYYNKVEHGINPLDDVRLAPYDVVYVPRTGIYEVWQFFNQYVQQFVPISWGFVYTVAPVTAGTTVVPSATSTTTAAPAAAATPATP